MVNRVISYCIFVGKPRCRSGMWGEGAYRPLSSGSGLLRIFYKLKTMMKSKRLILCLLGLCGLVRCRSSTDRSVKDGLGELGYRFVESGAGGEGGAQVYDGLGAFVESLDVLRQQEVAPPAGAAGVPLLDLPPVRRTLPGGFTLLTRGLTPEGEPAFRLWPKLEDQRVQGNEWAVGLGYGYHWILSRHWSLEAELGLGYSFADFDAYTSAASVATSWKSAPPTVSCPPKLSVSFIYVFK